MNLCPSCGTPNYNSKDIKIMQEMIRKGHGIPKSRYICMFSRI